MNCWNCKNLFCRTVHQPGWGTKESKICTKRHIFIEKVKDANECEGFEEGKSERENWIL